MPPSRFIIGRLSVHLYACKHARMHVRHGRQFAVLCICLCLYGDESLMRQAPTIRTCIGNGTSRMDYRSKRHQEVRMSSMPFLRFSHVASYKISFVSCSLTRADINAHFTRYALLYKVLSQMDSRSMMNSCKFNLLVFYNQIK
jgi:hypothetical protein